MFLINTLINQTQCITCHEPLSPPHSLPLILCRSFEEMEAQISASIKTPVLSSRPGPEGSAGDKGRKRESESLSRTQSSERDEQVSQTHFIITYVISVSRHPHVRRICRCWFHNIRTMSLFSHNWESHSMLYRRLWLGPPPVVMILIKAESLMIDIHFATPSFQLELSDLAPNAATQTKTQRFALPCWPLPSSLPFAYSSWCPS